MGGLAVTPRLMANRDSIIAAYVAGQTTRQLAVTYATSKTTMTYFLKRICRVPMRSVGWGLSVPRLPADQELAIVARYCIGYPMVAVAREYDLPESHVQSILRRHDRPIGRQTRAPALNVPTDTGHLGYLAGLVDGEGSIVFDKRRRRSIKVQIVNTDASLIKALSRLGGSVFWHQRRNRQHRPLGEWRVGRAVDCLALLTAIEPYLIIKRDRAREAISLLRELITQITEATVYAASPVQDN